MLGESPCIIHIYMLYRHNMYFSIYYEGREKGPTEQNQKFITTIEIIYKLLYDSTGEG